MWLPKRLLPDKIHDYLFGTDDEYIDRESSEPEKMYRKLKAKLQAIDLKKKSKPTYSLCVIISVIAAIFLYCIYLDSLATDTTNTVQSIINNVSVLGIVFSVIMGILAGCALGIYIYMTFELQAIHLRSKIFEYELNNMQDKIEDDIFENSLKMSYKYLDQYYLQTKEQAQKGFFVTVSIAVLGALLIFVGIAAMFFEKVEPSYITCASGVITEFIAAIFFYLYNKTVSSMSRYHNKLVLSQNISIALKISDSLPLEDSTKIKNLIVTELLKDINVHLVKDDSSTESSS